MSDDLLPTKKSKKYADLPPVFEGKVKDDGLMPTRKAGPGDELLETRSQKAQRMQEATGAAKGMYQSVGQGGKATRGFDAYDPIQWAKQNLEANQIAEKSRLGGQYTPAGLELSEKLSQLNAMDRLRARSLIGIGGTQIRRVGY